MLPKFKKQIIDITVYRHNIAQSCLFKHLIFVLYKTGSVKWHILRNKYIWIKVFKPD